MKFYWFSLHVVRVRKALFYSLVYCARFCTVITLCGFTLFLEQPLKYYIGSHSVRKMSCSRYTTVFVYNILICIFWHYVFFLSFSQDFNFFIGSSQCSMHLPAVSCIIRGLLGCGSFVRGRKRKRVDSRPLLYYIKILKIRHLMAISSLKGLNLGPLFQCFFSNIKSNPSKILNKQ